MPQNQDLMEQLERQITPAVTGRATDTRQLDQVRHVCPVSVADVVRLWLERKEQWHPCGITALPAEPTLKLLQ